MPSLSQGKFRFLWGTCGSLYRVLGLQYRHDMVNNVLFDVCRRAVISGKKEAPVNFLTDPLDGRFTLRPADVLIFGWVGRKHACVNLTRISPLVGFSSRGFTVRQAALKAVLCKVTKYKKACIKNQHVFVPFAFDTFGFLAPEAVKLLNRVQRVMHSNVVTLISTNIVFKRISFSIQKGLATQLIARLRSPTMQENEELDKEPNKQENERVGVKTYDNVIVISECDKKLNTIPNEIDCNGIRWLYLMKYLLQREVKDGKRLSVGILLAIECL
uniref:Putative reverse transcriptase domain-containing protein n=1 Tax=Tanacetum cinerariifolium TaxID=118510 RepID=A0A699JHY1_TANCI|nr:putative reverse transcriptase domain-containing protein [Tanacetum cinerariifolium]